MGAGPPSLRTQSARKSSNQPENRYSTRDWREIVLIVEDEKNRRDWKKGKVVRHVQGRDGVIRGVILQ